MDSLSYDEDFYDFDDENDEDELDLFKLVSTDSNDLNQYLVFKGSNEEWYAMNVSKIEEVIVFDKNIDISYNNDTDNIIFGTADIRDRMTALIYFDEWYGNKKLDDSDYELIILANYGGHKLGIIVKEVASISIIEADTMSDNSQNNLKSTFISKIMIDGEMQMCTIYDGDKMLLDVFDTIEEKSHYNFKESDIAQIKEKVIFFADDSRFVRMIVEELFEKLGVTYKIFNDGLFLTEYLTSHPQEHVDLFVTDLEMPNMGGREVIVSIRERILYKDTPILVHTNMSNNAMEDELLEVGALDIIGKINMLDLGNAIIKVLGR